MQQATRLRLGNLPGETLFALEPDAAARAALADVLGIEGIRRLRFSGRVVPAGRRDWTLEGRLSAEVVQACVVTLAPVRSHLDEPVERRYVEGLAQPQAGTDTEMPEDENVEPLPETLDLEAVMAEALTLALPPWPRAEGVELGAARFAEPGTAPMTDEDARPFAALKALRDRKDD